MNTVIGVGLWQASCECGVFTVSLSGKNCSLRLTPLALDGANAPDFQQLFPADVLDGEGTLPKPPRQ
jgi:hypothetical protein